MSKTTPLRHGMVIDFHDHHWVVESTRTIQSAKTRPTVHVTLRNLKNGHTADKTLEQLGKIEEVSSQIRPMQFLYAAGEKYVFMDSETFEQSELGKDIVDQALPLMAEGEIYRFLTIEGDIISMQIPDVVEIDVADTAAVEHGGGSSNVHKEATLASGLVVQVPLFIKTGDRIKIGAHKHVYQGKAHA